MSRSKIDYNLNLLAQQMNEFERYLLSEELFWPLSHRAPAWARPYLRLTTGNLLLNINEISAQLDSLTPIQQQEFYEQMSAWDMQQRKWLSAVQRKSIRELRSRTDLWEAYITDLVEEKDSGETYRIEVRNRVIFDLLSDLLQDVPEFKQYRMRIRQADKHLRGIFLAGPFIWAENLQPLYPDDLHWYLYGIPFNKEDSMAS